MNTAIDRTLLKQVALTQFDIRLLSLLSQTGGEYAMPETPEGRALVETVRLKKLVTIVENYEQRPRIRLTDEGRLVLEQLMQMARQPKVEIANK